MAKRRKYSEDYLNIGFTTVLANNAVEKPECVLCDVVLSVESIKPSKLKRHLETKHLEHAEKDLEFFKRHELQSLEKKFQRYFPELTGEEEALVRHPFSATLDVSSIPDEVQDEFLDLLNDFGA
ncbi:Zinc finger BED domain-containing protein 5-like 16 [Homarus americanus]|uniref:Zinc finger BED domain-containing protein 5-like 16 n=1 Tax=Homarus americanus TaxID=6706 RepID=A0A8J5MPK1_HOMAM|nr:Zinc finger BED domain-containing protein 5-like 16 [Homarus americanus]